MNEKCLRCGGDELHRRTVIEHVACGCVRPRAAFEREGRYDCPKCRADDIGGDAVRETATFYECESCGARFDRPMLDSGGERLRTDGATADTQTLVEQARRDAKRRGPGSVLSRLRSFVRVLMAASLQLASHPSDQQPLHEPSGHEKRE